MKVRSRLRILGCTAVFFLMLPMARWAAANELVNGGFETPVLSSGAFITIGAGGSGEPPGFGWTVPTGNVDVAHLPVTPFVEYTAYEGVQALDLNGDVAGAISQNFATVAGQSYGLFLAYADNPVAGGVSSASIAVTDIGSSSVLLSTSIFHSSSTNSPPNADWLTAALGFTATGSTTRLLISSTSADTSASGGIILDAVDVHAVPEPMTATLLTTAIAGLLGFRRCAEMRGNEK